MSHFDDRRRDLLDEVPLADWQGSTIRRLVVVPKDRLRKPRRDSLLVQLHAAMRERETVVRALNESAARRLQRILDRRG